jgi:hypothetical protein
MSKQGNPCRKHFREGRFKVELLYTVSKERFWTRDRLKKIRRTYKAGVIANTTTGHAD